MRSCIEVTQYPGIPGVRIHSANLPSFFHWFSLHCCSQDYLGCEGDRNLAQDTHFKKKNK